MSRALSLQEMVKTPLETVTIRYRKQKEFQANETELRKIQVKIAKGEIKHSDVLIINGTEEITIGSNGFLESRLNAWSTHYNLMKELLDAQSE